MSKKDRKSLSLVSRYIHDAVKETLWQSITIEADELELYQISVAEIPKIGFKLAKELHFRSSIKHNRSRRCPHLYENPDFDYGTEDNPVSYESGDLRGPYFDCLAASAVSALSKFSTNQLKSFRYALASIIYIQLP